VAFTAEQLQKLEDIRARGVLTIRDADGRSTTYQSGEALDAAINQAKRDVAASDASATRVRFGGHRYLEFGRG